MLQNDLAEKEKHDLELVEMKARFGYPTNGLMFKGVYVASKKDFDEYYAFLYPFQRFQDSQMADLGVQSILFGGAPIVYFNPFPDRTPIFKVTREEFAEAMKGVHAGR